MSRFGYVIGFVVIALLSIALFRAKEGARQSAERIAHLQHEIEKLEEDIDLLETEFAHLSRRERIAELAEQHLGMAPARADQLVPQGTVPLPLDDADMEIVQ